MLTNFSIAKDKIDIIPVFKQILTIAPEMKIMGSPSSAPAWMKTNGMLSGGQLKPEAYDVYARYFIKYLSAYKDEGISIDAITPQNVHEMFKKYFPMDRYTVVTLVPQK